MPVRYAAVPSPSDVGAPARRAIEGLAARCANGTILQDASVGPSKLAQTLAYARRSNSGGQVVSNVTNTVVNLGTTNWNLGSSMLNTGTYPNSLVAPVSGFYDCSYHVVYSNTTGDFRVAVWMETSRSGVRYAEQYASRHIPGHGFAGSESIYLAAGDRVTVWTYHDRGATYDIVSARLTGSLSREMTVTGAP